MTSLIHPSSTVSKSVKLGENVKIGPYCNIDGNISIGDNTDLKSQVKKSPKTKELNKKKTRESFRAKAVDFSKKEKVFKNKTFEVNEIKDVSPKEEEKRNGWWNQ